TPFGLQAHQGAGSIGNPDGPAYNPAAPQRGSRGSGGRGAGRGAQPPAGRGENDRPGLTSAAVAGGYTISFWVADVAAGDAKAFWHNDAADRQFTTINTIQWATGDRVIFQAEPEEWIRVYSVAVKPGATGAKVDAPIALTPGDGMVENMGLSSD